MTGVSVSQRVSERQGRFYDASHSEASALLRTLLEEEVRPIIHSVVFRRLVSLSGSGRSMRDDVDDVVQEAAMRVAQQLSIGRDQNQRIVALVPYCVKAAEHACDEYMRRTFRKRYNAMKRVLVHLRENDAFYEWRLSANVRCGALSSWPPPPPLAKPTCSEAIRSDSRAATNEVLKLLGDSSAGKPPGTARCIAAALTWAGGALSVDDLTLVLQASRNEFDEVTTELREEVAAAPGMEVEPEVSEFLCAIWQQIRLLQPNQARALLLNLRIKGEFGIEAFVAFGAATIAEIAVLLGFSESEFEHDILPELPWADRAVAKYLGCTEEQVTGLRSSARRTMAARMVARGEFPDECFRFHL